MPQMSLILSKIVCFIALLLAVVACQPSVASSPLAATPSGSPLAMTPTGNPLIAPTQGPAAVESTSGVWDLEWTFGPGPLTFLNATAGLEKLSSYQSTLTIAFRGTKAGKPEEWSTNYVMLATHDPAGRQLTITNTGEGSDPANVYKAEEAGVAYERRDDTPCTAVVLDQKKSLTALWEPASFLIGIQGGEKVGSETVNGLATDRYTFDERALGPFPPSKSTGQMWVATNGGFIVRYLLTTEAKADYFGEGIEGTITWDYQLTGVNQPVVIDLPKDCPAGMIDAPRLSDAANLQNVPGLVGYITASSPAEVIEFYQKELTALGWKSVDEPVVGEILALQEFTRADQRLSVITTTNEDGTSVQMLLGPLEP